MTRINNGTAGCEPTTLEDISRKLSQLIDICQTNDHQSTMRPSDRVDRRAWIKLIISIERRLGDTQVATDLAHRLRKSQRELIEKLVAE